MIRRKKVNKRRKEGLLVKWLLVFLLFIISINMKPCYVQAKKGTNTYTISPKSAPCDKSKTFSNYNNKTKQYYMVLSYLKKLETEGGGTLVFQKGNYTITNTLFVPSNVTIRFEDRVKIIKGDDTGTAAMPASKSIFVLCAPSKSNTEGAYSKYKGVKNVKFIGEGNVVINLNYDEDVIGIMMGHNQNITIEGITFQNMKSGHFIEMDASKNVKVQNCTFKNHQDSDNNNKEAINLDTPDKETEGFHAVWTSYDKTPNYNVTIKNCEFTNLERAIGTHKYSEGKYHTKITIENNTITNCDKDAIRVMNWKNFTIQDNQITNVANQEAGYRAILVSGASKMTITNNEFADVARPIQFIAWKNTGAGEDYAITYNTVTEEECELMKKNSLNNVQENFIRINHTYNEYIQDTDKITID